MAKPELSDKQRIAFKIGARARKFVLEGCLVEGYDYLYAALNEARAAADRDPEMLALLETELAKFERRVEALDADE